jgi:hypothetical protein
MSPVDVSTGPGRGKTCAGRWDVRDRDRRGEVIVGVGGAALVQSSRPRNRLAENGAEVGGCRGALGEDTRCRPNAKTAAGCSQGAGRFPKASITP